MRVLKTPHVCPGLVLVWSWAPPTSLRHHGSDALPSTLASTVIYGCDLSVVSRRCRPGRDEGL